MRELEIAEAAFHDLQRVVEFAEGHQDGAGRKRLMVILRSLEVLLASPFIGRPSGRGRSRELVIGRGATGLVARYRLDDDATSVVVLRVRGQREAGYDDDDDL